VIKKYSKLEKETLLQALVYWWMVKGTVMCLSFIHCGSGTTASQSRRPLGVKMWTELMTQWQAVPQKAGNLIRSVSF
jgi:hypothetical protein